MKKNGNGVLSVISLKNIYKDESIKMGLVGKYRFCS